MSGRRDWHSQHLGPAQFTIIASYFFARKDITNRNRHPVLELNVWLFGMICEPIIVAGENEDSLHQAEIGVVAHLLSGWQ